MAAKHYLIYYKRGTGTFVVTEPLPWAKENQQYFSSFNFQGSNHPRTNEIEKWLIENKGFKKVLKSEKVVLLQNLDLDLEI